MKQITAKRSLTEIKKAWQQQVASSPQLSEYWLSAAMQNLPALKRRRETLSLDYCYGLALSVLASLLVFVSSNILYQVSEQDDWNLVYLLNSHELSFFIRQ